MSTNEIKRIQTDCCVVGGGPAGVVLAYMLAQIGVKVLLLEAHHDFDRDFRGDTIHSGIMELLDDMGLADELLTLPHAKMRSVGFNINGQQMRMVDFGEVKTKFPWVTMMPQSEFLEYMVDKAEQFEGFQIRMGARADELIWEDGKYGVVFQDETGEYLVEADLIVAADGRHSKIRKLLNFVPKKTAVPMDVIWFRVPRKANDGIEAGGYVSDGHLLIVLERKTEWQIGFIFLKGSFSEIKAKGIDWLKDQAARILPALDIGMQDISNWKDVAVLNVESSRLKRWYSANALLIGDAAHVMSPVGGIGINYAIQDAIVAAGIVGPKLLSGNLEESDLKRVQNKRIWPTRIIQSFQAVMQKRVVNVALRSGDEFRVPLLLRFRFFRKFMARFLSHGLLKVRVPRANRARA